MEVWLVYMNLVSAMKWIIEFMQNDYLDTVDISGIAISGKAVDVVDVKEINSVFRMSLLAVCRDLQASSVFVKKASADQ